MYEILILILSIFHVIYGYPDGAPERACFYMIPRHTHPHTGLPVLKQRAVAPYRITVDNTTFRSNSAIRVTISGAPFKGFFIIAAEEGSKDWPSGVFYSEDPHQARTVWCSTKNDAATHSNDRWKDSVSLLWYGPSFTPADMIRFVATVVTNRTTYWVDIMGPIMTQAQVQETEAQEGGAGLEGGGPLLSTGLDPWGYPTTASWMNSRSGGGARGGGGFNRGMGSSATEGGFSSRGGGGGEGAAPTRTPAGEGGTGWGEPTASTFGRGFGGGRGGVRGSSMNPFLRLFSSLFGLKK
uniref:Ferric-chelate reductase 1 n=1 Tax=Gigantidas platifrons TaxID=2830794 RepID=A0A100XKJ2_9BIVA